jgi:integrase
VTLKLGVHSPHFGLAEARLAAASQRVTLSQGHDPRELAAERVQAKLEEAATQKTVNDVFEDWASIDLIRLKDGGEEVKRMFRKDVLPKIGSKVARDVGKRDIMAVTDALLARGVRRMSKLIFALMRQMFRFAQDRDLVASDPTSSIRKANIGGKDTERDRVLTEAEIVDLLRRLPKAKLIPSTEIAIWLALSTCCRIGELLNAEWHHINFQTGEWLIPDANSKNGKAHVVYLSAFALRKFTDLYELNGTTTTPSGRIVKLRWCFPDRTKKKAVCSKTVTKQIGDRQREDKKPMKRRSPNTTALLLERGRWTPHDLRRTGATMMTALGVMPEVAERCLNHIEQNKVKRIYQRHSYEKEMREAWRVLGEKLDLLTQAPPPADRTSPQLAPTAMNSTGSNLQPPDEGATVVTPIN